MDKSGHRHKNYSFQEKKLVLEAYFQEIAKEDHVNLREFSSVCGVNYWTLRDWLEAVGWDPARIPELHRVRQRRRESSKSALPEAVQELILKIKAQNGSWGPLKIKQYLYRHEQTLIPQTVIYRLLKAHGLVAERRQPEAGEKNCRRFEYPYPLAAVQMDLLTVTLAGGQRLYLVTLLDDFSRFVLNSRFIAVKTMTEVTGVFTEAVRRYGVMDKLLTDCGSEFVSWQSFTDFETLLAALDVEYIASGPDRKENQGKLERWHQTVRQAFPDRQIRRFDLLGAHDLNDFLLTRPWMNEETRNINKLSLEDKIAIALSDRPSRELAAKYGVHHSRICAVRLEAKDVLKSAWRLRQPGPRPQVAEIAPEELVRKDKAQEELQRKFDLLTMRKEWLELQLKMQAARDKEVERGHRKQKRKKKARMKKRR